MRDIVLKPYEPGLVREVARLHADYYAAHWAFDERFAAQVARELRMFINEFDAGRDGFWWADSGGTFAGAIAVDGSRYGEGQARLRWFIVPELFQGGGIGSRLMDSALVFCRERDFSGVHLWTFAGLDAARALYEKSGFRQVGESVTTGWGPVVTEQKFVLG